MGTFVSYVYGRVSSVSRKVLTSQCFFSTGDILGRALQNLDGLLKMPYGCGEQNMALLAPNIYILQYLKNTQQLTATIKEKATNFLTTGESLLVSSCSKEKVQVWQWANSYIQHQQQDIFPNKYSDH